MERHGWLIGDQAPRTSCFIVGMALFFWINCASSSFPNQDGFVSIDCGSETNYTDKVKGLYWKSDANYIQTGTSFTVHAWRVFFTLWNPDQLGTLRFFDERNRDCYVVKTEPNSKYLIRAVFFRGDLNRTDLGPPSFRVLLEWVLLDGNGLHRIRFSREIENLLEIETCHLNSDIAGLRIDGSHQHACTKARELYFNEDFGLYSLQFIGDFDASADHYTVLMYFSWSREAIMYSPGGELNVCLVRDLEGGPSFISTLEFRKLDNGMYNDVVNSSNVNFLDMDLNGFSHEFYNRLNFGGDSQIYRYPVDKYDRIWRTFPGPEDAIRRIWNASASSTPSAAAPDQPPINVTNKGWVYSHGPSALWYGLPFASKVGEVYITAYFQELDGNASATNVRGMNFNINDKFITSFNGSYDVTEVHGPVQNITANYVNISVSKASWSTLGPIINALEIYSVHRVNASRTSPQDVSVLHTLQTNLSLTDWTGDPCVPVPFAWLSCSAHKRDPNLFRITNLNLAGRGIAGPILPDISKLTALTALSLNNNSLTDFIPDFRNLVHLKTLNLENNRLRGSIPGFDTLSNLTELRLGHNNLTDVIPDFRGPLQLKHLYLENNKLNGTIPRFKALSYLTQLSVENNQLSGEVPRNLVNKVGLTISRENNPRLSCSACEKEGSGSYTGAILGGVLGGFAGVVATVWIIWILCTRKRRARDRIIKNMFRTTANPTELDLLIFKRRAAAGAITVLSLQDVSDATKKFSRKIGSGGFGPVYHGNLPSGQEVAVKVKSKESRQGMNEFLNEVDLLSRIHHRNLVSLVGYCGEAEQQILITVFLPNGTLRSHLSADQSRRHLDWKTRLDIAVNAAKGIKYLHTDCVPRIIHRDVKSNNILLDEAMVAKVADFGISKQTPEGTTSGVDTGLRGTFGYIDPEYFSSQRLTPKSDVYSFGVVLMEIISGRHPLSSDFPKGCETLLEWVEKSVQAERHADVIDPFMTGKFKHESMMMILSLALSSTAHASADRPDMAHVVRVLTEAIEIEHSYQISSFENSPSGDHVLGKVRRRRELDFAISLQNLERSDPQGRDGTGLFPP